ncbi:MAG: type 1 glutamine amidotransferase [Bdellovibrionota bacterium]
MTAVKIGMSSCIFHADPQRDIFKGKTLLYLEESMAHYAMSQGALVYMIPTVHQNSKVAVKDLVAGIDGLLLQGGVDVSPLSYGEDPLDPAWRGDKVRDDYEIALLRACLEQNKPVFGICRGLQLMNVAFGGTLFQDIQTQNPSALLHRNWDIYDKNFHQIDFVENGYLAGLYPDVKTTTINSVHHQAIKDLGENLQIEALSSEDNIIEAIKLKQNNDDDPWCLAVQWHPEFQDLADKSLLNPEVLMAEFCTQVVKRAKI